MNKTIIEKFLNESLSNGWKQVLGDVFHTHEILKLAAFLENERASGRTFYPPVSDLFRAFKTVDFHQVRVVILGQDPYHGDSQANGLAFAVNDGIKAPPSLKNIFKEVAADLAATPPQGTTLEGWAQQGVLLLNTVLTVRANEAFSHRGQGWEEFTERVLRALNDHPDPLVFLLWGTPAHRKCTFIDTQRHLVLKAAHPSPLSAHRGYFGCRHFSQANRFLSQTGRQVDWLKTTLV